MCRQCYPLQTRVNNTNFVDPVYGSNKRGERENPNKPFRTIKKAISKVKSGFWSINLAPGQYNEMIVVPAQIQIIGSGTLVTLIEGQIILSGNNTLSNFSLSFNNDFPIISMTGDNIKINNLSINHSTTQTSILSSLSGVALILDTQIVTGATSVILSNSGELRLTNVSISVSNSLQTQVIVSQGGRIQTNGGVISAATADLIFYKSTGGLISVQSGGIIANNNNLTYLTYNNGGNINVANNWVNFAPVDQNLQVAAFSQDLNSSILLSSVGFLKSEVPQILGEVRVIKMNAYSKDGNVVSTGGQYFNILPITQDEWVFSPADRTLVNQNGDLITFSSNGDNVYKEGQIIQIAASPYPSLLKQIMVGDNIQDYLVKAGQSVIIQWLTDNFVLISSN